MTGNGVLIWRDHTVSDVFGTLSGGVFQDAKVIADSAVINAEPTQVGNDVHFVEGLPVEYVVGPVGVVGDYNDNGIVDAADYTVWQDNVGAPAGTLPNDIHGGPIDRDHYNTWVANYGSTLGAGSLSDSAVPEPASVLLLIMAAGAAFVHCRSKT